MNPWEALAEFEGDVKVYYDNLYSHLCRYPNRIFVETGTLIGNGIQMALNAGFEIAYSIEIKRDFFQSASYRFREEILANQVHLYLGNSETVLDYIVKQLKEPATFWLDAHISSQYGETLAKNCPIMEELDAIASSTIRNHSILIDDINCFDSPAHDNIRLASVMDRILAINPAYKFEVLDAVLPKNILAARV